MANRLLKNSGQFFLLAVWKLEENNSKKNEKEIGSKKKANVSVAAGNEGNIFLLRKQKRGQEEKKYDFYFDCMQRDEKSTKLFLFWIWAQSTGIVELVQLPESFQ